MRSRSLLAAGVVLCLGVAASAARNSKDNNRTFRRSLPQQDQILHAINRLTFGPRPGDTEWVKAIGLKKWIDLELHPERIPENPLLLEKLKPLDSLFMTSEQMVDHYPPPQMVRRMLNGAVAIPNDPDRRMMIQKLVERFERRQKQGDQALRPEEEIAEMLTPEQLQSLRTGTPAQRLAAFEALPVMSQDDILLALPAGVRQGMFAAAPPVLRRRIELVNGPQQVVALDLAEGKLMRAVYSERQLEEVLTDFWFNHFNVYLDKGADHFLITAYERDVIRPHVLGKFRDLLEATAKSPAMLFYLDNWQSAAPKPAANGKKASSGLNENYGRELLELHTLGVDGGYTQKDVTEVARCFTGWSIVRPELGGGFTFNSRMHDTGEKTVLGVRIPAGGGIEDGEKVLDILAHSPATAHFIARKLAMRFVADDPPQSVADNMAKTFLKTNGDLREVMRTMFASKEFWSVGAYRSKMKSPLELVASAVRAVNGNVDYASTLVNQVAQMGEPLYRKQEPTGYSNSSKEWLNSAGLLARMNFALSLAGNRVQGVTVDAARAAKPDDTGAGISLGSPDFEKR